MPRGAGTTAAAAPRIDQGATPRDSGGAGPGLGPEEAIPRCARSFRRGQPWTILASTWADVVKVSAQQSRTTAMQGLRRVIVSSGGGWSVIPQ